MIESEEMRDIRHRQDELSAQYKFLKNKEIEAFQKNPINTALIGKYFRKFENHYVKILDVPQFECTVTEKYFNEYQFPVLEIFLGEKDAFCVEDTIFVKNGQVQEGIEITEEEFKNVVKAFFQRFKIEM